MADLSGRTVFITGSGGVLGSTYVKRMLAEGARVVATDLAGPRADGLVERHGGDENFRFHELDVSDEAAVEGTAEVAAAVFASTLTSLVIFGPLALFIAAAAPSLARTRTHLRPFSGVLPPRMVTLLSSGVPSSHCHSPTV